MSIGHNLGAVYVGTATATGSKTTLLDTALKNADDYLNEYAVIFTSGDNDGSIRFVDDYTGLSKTMTFRGSDLTAATASGDTYELWDRDMPPARIHDFINRAIRTVPRKAAPPYTDYSVHTGRGIRSFDLPTTLVGITDVYARASVTDELIHDADTEWDEQTVSGVTVVVDDEDYRRGYASNRFATATIGATTILASDSISALDLRGYTHVEFWIKSTVVTAAGNLVLRLSATANGGSATDDLSIPALTANVWTFCRVALGNPHLDSAIISVALRQVTDLADAYIWVDEIRAVVDDSGVWTLIHPENWWIDDDERELVFSEQALPAYNLLRVTGLQKPTELSADATSCDVEPEFIIAKATALALRARADRRADRREAAHLEADRYEQLAQMAMNRIHVPQNVRWVSD